MPDAAILFLAACGTALATGLGAVPVFLLGSRAAALAPTLLGFAAGVMGVAAVAGLLIPASEEGSSQRALAKKLGVSQPRVVKLESGEHNPEVDTIINAVRRLGIEFLLDVAPAGRKPALVTARAQKRGAIAHDDVSVVAASSV